MLKAGLSAVNISNCISLSGVSREYRHSSHHQSLLVEVREKKRDTDRWGKGRFRVRDQRTEEQKVQLQEFLDD